MKLMIKRIDNSISSEICKYVIEISSITLFCSGWRYFFDFYVKDTDEKVMIVNERNIIDILEKCILHASLKYGRFLWEIKLIEESILQITNYYY